MRIEFMYSRPPEYFAAQLKPRARRVARRYLIAALVWAAIGAVFLYVSRGIGVDLFAGYAAFGFAVALPVRAWRSFNRSVTMPAAVQAPRTYVITDEALESSTELTYSRWTWQAVRRVEVRSEAYLFWQEGPFNFDVPRAPLTAEQEAELRALLQARGLLGEASRHQRA